LKKLLFIAGLLALTAAFDSEAIAQDERDQPLQEVFQTELVYPQEKGAFQLASTLTFGRVNKKFSSDLTVEYGLTRAWQIDLQWESFARKETQDGLMIQGSGDLSVGTKYSFMNLLGSNFHSAIGFELSLPASSAKKEIPEGKIEYQPYVVVAKDFPGLSRLQLFTQLGITFSHSITKSVSDYHHDEKTIEWNLGMFVPYRQVRFTTEMNWSRGAAENQLYLTPGIVWKLPDNLEFGVGVPIGLSREADGVKTILKLVYEFGGRKDREDGRSHSSELIQARRETPSLRYLLLDDE
jgi:hypothetical protein